MHYIDSPSMLQKLLAAIITEEWARDVDGRASPILIANCALAQDLSAKALAFLLEPPPLAYHEMAFTLARLHSECYSLLHAFAQDCKIPVTSIPTLGTEIDITGQNPQCFTIDTARSVIGPMYDQLKDSLGRTKKKELAAIAEKRTQVAANIDRYTAVKSQHDVRVSAAFAATFIALKGTPEKVSPVVKGIMSGIKVNRTLLCWIATYSLLMDRAKKMSICKPALP
jgi:TATA-binding protein-associated factor